MSARLGYALSALLLGAGAFVGFQFSGATFTDDSDLPAEVTAARDWTPPIVSVDDPGFVISDAVTITATASDVDTSVDTVEIQYRSGLSGGWTSLCLDSASPWACTWDTDDVDDGSFHLRAIATDVDGNVETSASVLTEVKNSRGVVIDPVPDAVSGSVQLTAHLVNWSSSGSSYLTFQASAAWTDRWVDLPGCDDLAGPQASCSFDTTMAPDGTYDLRVVANQGRRTYDDVQTGIEVDNTAPTVTIDQAAGQADPSGPAPVHFTAEFSEPVTGFDAGDVTVGGTVGGSRAVTVTGSGRTYTVSVSGFSGGGTLSASIGSGGASDAAGNGNRDSTSTDNVVSVDATVPTVTVEQAAAQADPTNAGTINFTVVFSKSVTGFAAADVALSGSAGGAKTALVTGSGTTYNVAVTGMTTTGTVVAQVPAGGAVDSGGNPNAESTSVDNSVLYDVSAPTVTVNQAATQKDPTNGATINFTAVFNEPVTGFTSSDVTIGGTAGGTKAATVTGSGTTYNVAVTGMTGTNVTVSAGIGAGKVVDLAGNGNTASTSTDNVVTRDTTAPTVTLVRATGQSTPTTTSPIRYTVTFSEVVTGFDADDLTITGTSGGDKVATVTGSGATYSVAIDGMTSDGTVIISQVAAGAATDLAGNGNTASSASASVRTITWSDGVAPTVTVNQAEGQADPTTLSPVSFTAVFSEPVTGFTSSDVTISGTAGGTKTVSISGSGPTYAVSVSGMTTNGTVIATIAANKAVDLGARNNTASTSTDNTVTYVACSGGSATLTATADAWTDQSSTGQNKGGDSSLSVESKSGNANKRAFVKFTLPTIPAGCSVTGATMRLHNASPTSGRTIDVYRAAATWTEGGITWANQPTTTGTAVGSATVSTAGVQQWSVLAHVQSQYSGTNNGFVLRDKTEGAGAAPKQGYHSRESGGTLPQLVITWE